MNWSASSDFDRPDISTVSATLTGTTASFRVCSPATDVNRGVLLFLPSGGPNPQDWVHVELVKSTLGCWVGTATVAAGVTTIGQFHTMLCDAAGNCGASTNKARNYTASPSTQLFSLAVDPGPASNGLYPDPTTVTITAPAGTTFTASVDDRPPISCTGTCFVTVTGDGAHVVRAVSGGVTTEAAIPIDSHPPVVDVTSPPAGARYRQGEVVADELQLQLRAHGHRLRWARVARHRRHPDRTPSRSRPRTSSACRRRSSGPTSSMAPRRR